MASAVLPQLNLDNFEPQIFWLLIIFSLFYFVIKVKIVPYFYSELENRDRHILNNHQDARKLQKKAERLSDEYCEKIQAVHLRANDLINEAKLKVSRHVEIEKNRLNEGVVSRFNTHVESLQNQILQVHSELQENIHLLKTLAKSKVLEDIIEANNDNLKISTTDQDKIVENLQ